MKKYETPNISVERYGLANKVMDGYIDGDILETTPSAWEGIFKDPVSDEGVDGNILD